MRELILLGGGGHCKSVIDVVESGKAYKITAVLDEQAAARQTTICGYPVPGGDELIEEYVRKGCYFLVTVGQVKNSDIRHKLYTKLSHLNANMATVVASTAVLSKHAELGEGCVLMHHSVVNAVVKIGVNGIVNTSAIVEHDSRVGDFCHISTMATINADCHIGDDCFIGSNAVVNRGLHIGDASVIASMSLVTKNLDGHKTYFGTPVSE